uniref:Uncharacterized protein n=1 Tax=Apteryx owenii TaxID=8824 RepID=A0A8B9Q586_APTOW
MDFPILSPLYHHAEELEAFLKGVHAAYPSFTHLRSIGRSVAGSGPGASAGFLVWTGVD